MCSVLKGDCFSRYLFRLTSFSRKDYNFADYNSIRIINAVYLSIYLLIYLSAHRRSIYLSIYNYPFIYLSIINPSCIIHLPIYTSFIIRPSTYPSIYLSIYPSIYLLLYHSSVQQPSIHPSIQLPIYIYIYIYPLSYPGTRTPVRTTPLPAPAYHATDSVYVTSQLAFSNGTLIASNISMQPT